MNKITLSGNITRDAELRFTPDGTPVSNFSIGVREYRKNTEKQPLFIDLVIWGKRSEALNPYLKKGTAILVDGKLDVNKRTVEGGKTYTNVRVYVNELEFLGKKEHGQEDKAASQAGESAGADSSPAEQIDEVPF
jgi:single-strand DNA-binding protein